MALIIIIVIAAIILIPLAAIWAVNTLFGVGIVYTFWTWLAALVLCGIIGGSSASSRN